MKLFRHFLLLAGVWMLFVGEVTGQKPGFQPPVRMRMSDLYVNPAKAFLNKFSFTGTTGYGVAMYSHELNNVYFYQSDSSQIIVPITDEGPPTGEVIGFSNWFNRREVDTLDLTNYFDAPYAPLPDPVSNPSLQSEFRLATDTSALKMRSFSQSIPLTLAIHFNHQKFRIGGGATLERQYFKPFKPTTYKDIIRPFSPEVAPVFFQRYFGTVGYRFYDYWSYSFAAELQAGILRGGGKVYDYSLVQRGVFFNGGVSIEKNLSEYFRVILKPSIDYHTFNTQLNTIAIRHQQISFFLQAGVSINIPEARRCPIGACAIQMKHVHRGNNEILRGQPITKHQNPKVGQNHRKLFRYKWRNRNKLEPY